MEFFNCCKCEYYDMCTECVARDYLELFTEGLIEIVKKKDKEIADQKKALDEWEEFSKKQDWKLIVNGKEIKGEV